MPKSFEKMKSEYLAESPAEEHVRLRLERLKRLDKDVPGLFHPFHPGATRKEGGPKFLIDGFLPAGYLVILAGRPKEGKSSIATAIALSLATGRPFAGMNSVPTPVLWLANEESPEERAAVLKGFEMPDQMPPVWNDDDDYIRTFGPFVPLYTSYERIPIDTEDGLYLLGEWVKMTGAKLIVIDPLLAAISGRSLNDGWAARKSLTLLKEFCMNHQVTALVLHHTKRGYGGSGHRRVADSDQLAATASMEMLLSRDPQSGKRGEPYRFALMCKGRGAFANREWRFESRDPMTYWIAEDDPAARRFVRNRVEKAILSELGRGDFTIRELHRRIRETIPVRENWIWVNVTRLLEEGKIMVVKKEGIRRWFGLARHVAP